MRRREFLALAGAAVGAGLPHFSMGQSAAIKRLAVLDPFAADDPSRPPLYAVLENGLAKLGWVKDRNFVYDRIWLAGDLSAAPAAAKQLVSRMPDVIMPYGGGPTAAVVAETRSIPIVFLVVNDPVGQGLAQSMSHPGGNITGVAIYDAPIIGHWIALLLQIAPTLRRITVWGNPLDANFVFLSRWIDDPANRPAVPVNWVSANTLPELEQVFAKAGADGATGIVNLGGVFEGSNTPLIVDLAQRYHVPTITQRQEYPRSGGLMSYGTDTDFTFRNAAGSIDLILRGTKPGDIPILTPTKYQLVINAKTARALGLSISPTLFAAADEVIE